MADAPLDVNEIWKLGLAQLEVKTGGGANFKTWLADTLLLEIVDDKAIVGVKSSFHADWLRRKYHQLIQDTLRYISNLSKLTIEYRVSADISNLEAVPRVTSKPEKNSNYTPSLLGLSDGLAEDLKESVLRAGLNPKYTFANFVVGDSNRLAHAAALSVATEPGKIYNPYFIYGPTGLGKTHLAQSIAMQVLDRNPRKRVSYISAEGFMNEMVSAIRNGKNNKFREKYRELTDVLIIDDIQFISEWDKTKIELFNTLNSLQAANKQVIIISDRTPSQLEKLPARLLSRFQGGIVVDISRPDYEHRLAILARKAKALSIELNQSYLETIAKQVTDNIRELEGALQKTSLLQTLTQGRMLSSQELSSSLGIAAQAGKRKVPSTQVLKLVAQEYDLATKDIKGSRRTAEIALARQVCMYIMRSELNYKLEEIAKVLHRKDHTTVIHGVEKVTAMRLADNSFRSQLLGLIDRLHNV